jgi:hypothetical protein
MQRAIMALVALLAQPSLAAACSCARPTMEELIESGRDIAIFSARVVSVLTPEKGKPAITRLQIGEILKGEAPRVIDMTGVTSADNPCGVDFRPGEVRTMGAYKKDGRWFTDLCLIPRL